MARKTPNLNYAVNAVFYIGQTELAEQLALFARNKKLAWSPDVKIAMTKRPASVLEDDVFFKLKPMSALALRNILISLLKPIKEHDLFDLSDWLRDLDGVPGYLQSYWSNARIPKELDDVVAQALRTESSSTMAANPTWPLPPSREVQGSDELEDDDGVVDSKPVGRRTKPKVSTKKVKVLKGPAGRGKVHKSEAKAEEAAARGPVAIGELLDSARDALSDKKLVTMASKAVWTRVHKAVEALLNQNGMEITATRPQRFETEDKKQALVIYYVKPSSYGANGWHDFKAALLEGFGDGFIADIEAVNDAEPPKSFKVWFTHA